MEPLDWLRRVRYNPALARGLYTASRPLYNLSGLLQRQIASKVKRNGGAAVYDGIRLEFPIDVGPEFLSAISWHGQAGFEPSTWRVLKRFISEAGTFIDVGANVGFYSVLARLLKPEIETLSFEPIADIFAASIRFHKANGLPTHAVLNIALSDSDGEAMIYEPRHDHDVGHSSASTLVADSWQARTDRTATLVTTARLDTILGAQAPREPIVIKIDVEDYEAAVLRGAREAVARYRPAIVCEILPREHGNAETLSIVAELGYSAFAITEAGCFRMSAVDFRKPRTFTDFLLLPEETAAGAGSFMPNS